MSSRGEEPERGADELHGLVQRVARRGRAVPRRMSRTVKSARPVLAAGVRRGPGGQHQPDGHQRDAPSLGDGPPETTRRPER